jgi:hypothetical protein
MSELAYAISIGQSELAQQAECLVRSINLFAPESEIFGYLTEEEMDALSRHQQSFFERHTILTVGQNPIPEYPIAIKIEALRAALEQTSTEYVALVDTDTLVLNPIDVHRETSADFLAKPADISTQYWTSKDAEKEWIQLYQRAGKEYLGAEFETTVDRKPIPRYWNAGMVITNQSDLADEWLNLTSELYSEINDPFYTDQVSLALVAAEYNTELLSEQYNFPLPHRIWCPSNIRLLHYHRYRYLARVLNPRVKIKIRNTGVIYNQGYPDSSQTVQEVGIRLYNTIRRNIYQ